MLFHQKIVTLRLIAEANSRIAKKQMQKPQIVNIQNQ